MFGNYDFSSITINVLDIAGTAAYAFSGALRVLDRRPDFVGMLLLAGSSAIGAAIMRDILLGRMQVVFLSPAYAITIYTCTLLIFFYPRIFNLGDQVFNYFDAVGIGIFSALTARAAMQRLPEMTYAAEVTQTADFSLWLHGPSLVLITVFCCCAGGVTRDVVCQKPTVILNNELYATPIILGAIVFMFLRVWGLGEIPCFFITFGIAFGLRIAAIIWNIRLPRILVLEHHNGP